MPDQSNRAEAGEIAVSKQILNQAAFIPPVWLYAHGFTRLTEEQIAARLTEREAEWATQTAKGLVGITDESDYEGGPDWREVERGQYVQKWVTAATWDRYTTAAAALYAVEEEIDHA